MQAGKYDVVIIGAGVAGMTAALYLKRSGVNCLMIEGDTPGGQVVKTSIITNYPGFKSITGAELATKMLMQLKALEVEILYEKVINIKLDHDMKVIVLDDGQEILTNKIIIATGRKPRKLNLPNEERFTGHGVSYCATCDGALFKDEEVVVVGGGDSALEEAIYLSSICQKVTIIHRSESFRAKSYLQDDLQYIKNIEIIKNANIVEFLVSDEKFVGVRINHHNESENIKASACFVFIGYIPESDAFDDLGIIDEEGYISTNDEMETNIKGIYAIGDIRKKGVYQIVTATNDGAIAAINILKNIS